MTVSLICAYRKFIRTEDMTINSSYPEERGEEEVIGFPVYLSIEGQISGAYALFGCDDWETITSKQQLDSLQKDVTSLYLSLPFKEIKND